MLPCSVVHQIGDASEVNPVLQELFKERLLLSLGQLTKDEFGILMSQIATSNIARNQADGILMSQFATSNSEGSPTDSNLKLAAFRKESSGINDL